MLKQKLSIYTKQLKKKRPHRKSGNNLTQKNREDEPYHTQKKNIIATAETVEGKQCNKTYNKTRRFMDKDMTYAYQQTKKKEKGKHRLHKREKKQVTNENNDNSTQSVYIPR